MTNISPNINLSEIDISQILKEVKCLSSHDFSMYAQTFIRGRIEKFMNNLNISSKTDFIYKLNKSEKIVGLFLDCVYFEQFELFRDFEAWNYLNENILPKLEKKNTVNIHLPYTTGAEDLHSLLYILNNFKTTNFNIFVTGVTHKHISEIKKAKFTKKHKKDSEKNISLLKPKVNLDDVFTPSGNIFEIKSNFNGKITYKTCNFFNDIHIIKFDLIIFKNKMIYFNSKLKDKAEINILNSLNKNSYLIIGEKEQIKTELSRKIKQLSNNLSIYKRKLFS